jgi:hypothetical protein
MALTSLLGAAEGNKVYSNDDSRIAWWQEARFGMFIHWGLFFILAGNRTAKPIMPSGSGQPLKYL